MKWEGKTFLHNSVLHTLRMCSSVKIAIVYCFFFFPGQYNDKLLQKPHIPLTTAVLPKITSTRNHSSLKIKLFKLKSEQMARSFLLKTGNTGLVSPQFACSILTLSISMIKGLNWTLRVQKPEEHSITISAVFALIIPLDWKIMKFCPVLLKHATITHFLIWG